MKKFMALLLALSMVLSLVACGTDEKPVSEQPETETSETIPENLPEEVQNEFEHDDDILVVGYDAFSQKFSPFFAATEYDMDVAAIVSQSLLATDRNGTILQHSREGETTVYNGTEYTYYGIANCDIVVNENGTVDYCITLQDDILFSDGTNLTADDVIFTMYVLCDPTYDGPASLYTAPIKGLEAYRSGMESKMNLMLAAGEDNTDFDDWTEEEQDAFWADLKQAGAAFAQEIVDYCAEQGAEDVASAAELWGYTLEDEATTDDFFAAMCEQYEWNLAALSNTERVGSSLFDLMEQYNTWSIGVKTGKSAERIEGIQKTGDYALTVTTTVRDTATMGQLNFLVAPMHYYGDASLYDYDNNQFGFPKGDLSTVREKTAQPLGAGPYRFVSYENGLIVFEANETYWKGKPEIEYMLWEEAAEADKVTGIVDGTFDIVNPAFTADAAEALRNCNTNGELSGDVITTSTVDNLGYGYIGICANTVQVGGDADSDASKALRKAFATLFAIYREAAIDAYYGESATVIQYPISNTSWAAPKAADKGYQIAYSVDADGNQLYNADMTEAEQYAAAAEAARGFLEAAGYTFDEDGVAVSAPAGASLTYEFLIPAEGTGDHPAHAIVTAAAEALAAMGITLEINDLTDAAPLWEGLAEGTVEMWASAWNSTAEPDLYQIYNSENIASNEDGTGSNHYYIQDETLDARIAEADSATDLEERKTLYRECFDIILDWGVEVPVYQRQNAVIFSTDRLDMETVTPDMTVFWDWMQDIERLEMN